MKDIRLLEFDTLEDFVDLCDIVESHTKQDSLWVEELEKVTDTMPGQMQWFIEHPIKDQVVLQQISASLVKYRVHAVEIREIYTALMEQHNFPYAHTCEELSINWSKYEKNHLFKVIPGDNS
jgi:galactose-1-phosphate uridylyltransferase